MDMLLRQLNILDLADIFARHPGCSPAPYLLDPGGVSRARRLARKNGIWDDLAGRLDPRRDIPVLRRSAYRAFRRTGDRSPSEAIMHGRMRDLARASMAIWLDHPAGDLDYLQDLMWACCDDFTWVWAAHEQSSIDLGAAMLAAQLAEIIHVLGPRLEAEVSDRVRGQIERRIFDNYGHPGNTDFWKTVRMNWNHVCNSELIRAAMYLIDDPVRLANMLHTPIQHLTYAIDGFTDDGGCEEGPGYWVYGFGHFLSVGLALYNRTGGELNIVAGKKIHNICRFPLAVHIDGELRATFADADHGWIPASVAMTANRFNRVPELYGLCDLHADRSLKLGTMVELAMYEGQKAPRAGDDSDHLLSDLGVVKLRGKPGPQRMTLLALAGNNGVNHNHNDVGSFIVHRGGRIWLTDPGAPRYTAQTFSDRRYEIVFCNSRGHSVPVIDGRLQQEGAKFYGTLSVDGMNSDGPKTAVIDMTHAYPKGTVDRLVRTLRLDAPANTLTLCDEYAFARAPKSLQEAFITFEKATVSPGGRSVRLGPARGGLQIRAIDMPGRFAAERLVEESGQGRTGQVVTRVIFTPGRRTRSMILRFAIG